MQPATVSTVITSYNKGAFLAEAIESALAQDYSHHEIIVVDDGSTDNTREVVEQFGDRVRYFYQHNAGQAAARNLGIRESSGEFIAFLDGDDRWRKDKLCRQLPLFAGRPQVGVVFSHIASFSDRTTEAIPAFSAPGTHFQRGHVLEAILVHNFVPFSSTMVRRSAFDQSGCFDETCRIADDYDLFLRMARQFEFDFVDEVLVDYWVGDNRIGARLGTKFEHVMKIQRNFLARYYPEGFPNPRAVHSATARKYAEHGDWLLATGRQLAALQAHLSAATFEPWRLGRYRALLRDLIPNGVASKIKRGLAPR